MAAVHNTQATLEANWKEVYADSVENVVPESAHLQKDIAFAEADKLGDKYVQPVQLSQEHGVSYLGVNAGVTTLQDARAAVYKEAQVDGSSIILRSSISYNAADKMASSKKAFMTWGEMLVTNMVESAAKRVEIAALYGQSGIGTISAVSDVTGTNQLTISDFCHGIFAGMETAELDVFDGTTKVNTNAALVVSSVDFDTGKVTVTGNATDTAAIGTGDKLYFRSSNAGGGSYNEMAGLDKIVTNTGTLFNISAATYGLWKGTTYSCGSAALTLAKILAGVARAQARGLDSDVTVYVNPFTFADLNAAEAGLRRYDSSYKPSKADRGNDELCFYSGNGKVIIKSHLYVKPSDGFGVALKDMKRIGTTDITFKLAGSSVGSGDVFLHVPDKNALEIRCRTEQAIFCKRPARLIKFTGIVNS